MLLSSVKFLLCTLCITFNQGQKTLQNHVLLKKDLSLNCRQLRDRCSVTSIFRNLFLRKKKTVVTDVGDLDSVYTLIRTFLVI